MEFMEFHIRAERTLIRIQIYSSVMMQKRTFLETRDWLDVPWTSACKPKSLFEQLQDVACTIPGCMEDTNALIKEMAEQKPRRESSLLKENLLELKERVSNRLDAIDAWKSVWLDAFPQAYESFAHEPPDYPAHLFGPALRLESSERCYEAVVYYGMKYELCQLLSRLNAQMVGSESPQLSSLGMHDASAPAVALCRCVPYLLNASMNGSTGALIVRWFLLRIFHLYGPDTEQFRWIVRMLDRCTSLGLGGGDTYIKSHLTKAKVEEIFGPNQESEEGHTESH